MAAIHWVTYKEHSPQCNVACAHKQPMGKPRNVGIVWYCNQLQYHTTGCMALYVHALLLDYGSGSICHVAARKPSVSHIAHGTEHRWIQRLTIHMSSEILSSAWCHNSYAKSTSDVSSPLARVPKSCTRALNLLGLRDGVCVANRQNSWQLSVSKTPPDRSATIEHKASLHVQCAIASCLCCWFVAHVLMPDISYHQKIMHMCFFGNLPQYTWKKNNNAHLQHGGQATSTCGCICTFTCILLWAEHLWHECFDAICQGRVLDEGLEGVS